MSSTKPLKHEIGAVGTRICLGDKVTMEHEVAEFYGFPRGTVMTITAMCSGGKVTTLRKKKAAGTAANKRRGSPSYGRVAPPNTPRKPPTQ